MKISKNSEEKTIKKNKVLNEKMAQKRNLEKNTRVDEENKNRTTGILCKLCVTFIDLSGTKEFKLDYEI